MLANESPYEASDTDDWPITAEGPRSLQDQALNSLIEGFEQASHEAKNTHTCGGSVKLHHQARILIKPGDRAGLHGNPLNFPGNHNHSSLTAAACKAAVQGCREGSLEVSDPTRALKPTSFATDFKLAEHDVLGSVRKLAFPDLADLSAHLYKLNIRLPDDLLEAHLEMPRSGSTVGTLVVCFPTAHAGGQCVVQHQDSKVKYDWGLQFENSTGILQWAFFSSSAQHEILPVTSGAQVTLTYNLVAMPSELGPLQTVQLEAAPFGKALSRLLASAEFLPEGGSLGFSCKHVYPHTSAGFGNVLLKGIDAVVMATAKQLHLDVQMEPVWKPTEDDCLVKTSEGKSELKARVCDCEACSSAAGIVSGKYAVGGDLQLNISYDPLGKPHRRGKLAIQQLPESYNARPVREVQWVQKNFSFQLGLVGLGCKDSIFEPCSDDLDAMYSAAAIIVTIPPAEARMQLGPPVII